MLTCCYRILVVIALLFLPGVVGQCIDCNEMFKFHCEVNHTGYHCDGKAEISSNPLPPKDFLTSTLGNTEDYFELCTPYPLRAEFIKTYCCFFSPKLGCQLAINPHLMKFENRPLRKCMDCSNHCRCLNSDATPVKSWTVFGILGSLALS